MYEINTNQEARVRSLILGFFVLLFSTTGAVAADLTDMIQKRYETLQSFRAFFVQKLTNASSREVQERLGTIVFVRPMFIRWETTSPEAELLLIGQDQVWDYFPDEETAYRYTFDQVMSSKTMLRFVSGEANLKEDFSIRDLGQEGEFRHLQLIPKEPEPNLVEGEIWVHPDKNMLERVKLVDFFGNINELELSGIELDVPVPDSEFILTPPPGTTILDSPEE